MADKPPLVLIVDDDPSFLEILSIKLNTAGYRVEMAANGQSGVERVKELKPDLVLMDVQMPIKNGIDAVADLKQDPETKDTKIAFLTNLGDDRPDAFPTDAKLAKEAGAIGYLRKTDDLDNILAKVRDYLGT